MSSDPKYVKYTFDWKVQWADFDRIGKESFEPRHYFVTSFKNVSFLWYAKMCAANDASRVSFFIYYDDGPLDQIKGVGYEVSAVKHDGSLFSVETAGTKDYSRASEQGAGWVYFEEMDSTAFRTEYGLSESDRLTYQVTIKIPMDTFAYCIPSPIPAPCSPWAMDLYESINNINEGDSLPSDTKIAGRNGVVFNCHKFIVIAQSKALKTILQYPPTKEESGQPAVDDEQSVANPKNRKASAMDESNGDDVYDFPHLSEGSLKSILEYLYTGKAATSTLTVTELIEMGDAGEQYDLKKLKEFSAAELWKRVVIEDPACAFEIARFADLHDELKYLKHRALDIIAENYDHLGVKPKELTKRFGGTRGKELRNEFMEYTVRRLRPIISE